MLELKDYTFEELSKYIGSNSVENIKRKLRSYDVEFIQKGRGRNSIYSITKINDPLRVFFILDVGVSPQIDWKKFRNFLYVVLNDDDFGWRPDEMKEEYMRAAGMGMSRQTISRYTKILMDYGLISKSCYDCVYYKVYKDFGVQKHEIITREEYSSAWKIYWRCKKEEGYDTGAAFTAMYNALGGIPRKSYVIEFFPWYEDLMNWITEMILKDNIASREIEGS